MGIENFPTTVYLFMLIELLAVSYIDLFRKKIANIWSVLNIVVFCILLFILPNHYSINVKSFSYPLIFLFVGYVLFMLKIMGGGDSKYLSTMFLLVPENHQDAAMISLIYTTIFIGTSIILFNTFKNYKSIWESLKNRKYDRIRLIYGKKLTYAPVILLSWFVFGLINRGIIF
jgi:prepilin peptidase CpaA